MDNLTRFFSFELPTKIIYGANCLDNLCVELKENKGKKFNSFQIKSISAKESRFTILPFFNASNKLLKPLCGPFSMILFG